jgi:hypothetical protein
MFVSGGFGEALAQARSIATSATVSTLRRAFALPDAKSKPRKRKKKALSEETLLKLGRQHFAEDFPNPKRRGCPSKDQLKLLAEKPRKAKESVLNHISLCSPCYRAYSGFLHARKRKHSARAKN